MRAAHSTINRSARGGYRSDVIAGVEPAHDVAAAKRRLFARPLLVIPWGISPRLGRHAEITFPPSHFAPDVAGHFVE
jgi:hypothetical protein